MKRPRTNNKKWKTRSVSSHPEMKYYGFHACLQLFKARPEDIIRVYVEQSCVKEVSSLLKWCAKHNKAYHIVSGDELVKVSDSVHHEGLCILAKEKPTISFKEMLDNLNTLGGSSCLLYVDGVQNPHNVGSIMRVAAHFGIEYIIGERSLLPKVTPSSYRVAQGGAEFVNLVPLDNSKQALKQLHDKGYKAIATSSHQGSSLYAYRFDKRVIIILGSESEGIDQKLSESVKDWLMIPGTGLVESLNVSVAAGLLLGEYWRQMGVQS